MTRLVTGVALAVVVVCARGAVSPAPAFAAQPTVREVPDASGQLQGTATDERGQPVPGVVVSAVGTTSAFAVSDQAGRFVFGSLPPGPYLLRAHRQGFVSARASLVQVDAGKRTDHAVTLMRPGAPVVLSAGVARADAPPRLAETPAASGDTPDAGRASGDGATDGGRGELAWRLRHLRRGVLDDLDARDNPAGQAAGATPSSVSARLASAVPDFPISGQLNFLTSASFERPQDVVSKLGGPSHGVAHLSLDAPSAIGTWNLRGALTQGDLSSWTLAGAFVRTGATAHPYEAGVSYTTQRYEGGNAAALAALADGSRNAGAIYAYDHWKVRPNVTVDYGGRYARYDYLESPGLFSPEVAVRLEAVGVQLRGSLSRRSTAPGAEEFQSPSDAATWLPPERTFSSLNRGGVFEPERTTHLDLSARRSVPGGFVVSARAFRQHVDDQIAALFGTSLPGSGGSAVGHYVVASAGDLNAHGWGVGLSRSILGRVHGTLDYTESQTAWDRSAGDLAWVPAFAPATARPEHERLRDLAAAIDAEIPQTATRMFVFYRVNGAAGGRSDSSSANAVRFDVEVRQALPFLNFTNAQWAMLVTIRNVFREDAVDASTYDELLVIRPPKRLVGGLTVRF